MESNASGSNSLDDELAELFGADILTTPSRPPPANATDAPSQSTADEDFGILGLDNKGDTDIMSWLGESPSKTASVSKSVSKPSAPASVDNFFDEVFGDTSVFSPTVKNVTKDIQSEIIDAVNSSFPDIQYIKNLIHQAGYIPASVRGLAWCLFLTGAVTEDHEADYYHPTGAELADTSRLNADIDALITRMAASGSATSLNLTTCRQDLHDILVLYCVRRQVEYSPLYCSLLSPLIVSTYVTMPRSLASSCFYSLATEFVPIINLKPAAKEMATEVTHCWLRLLVGYHSPKLAQHLDRVLLGWELPSTEAFGMLEALQHSSEKKQHATLDDLERELGLAIDDPNSAINATWVTVDPRVSDHSKKGSKKDGCIPQSWIFGLFSGSLPPDQAGQVLDWAILENDRYAGVYLIAALLEIYSESLLKMGSSQIKDWIKEIATCQDNWYLRLQLPNVGFEQQQVSWVEFVNGWINAAADLKRTTPNAFRSPLAEVDSWASRVSELLVGGLAPGTAKPDIDGKHDGNGGAEDDDDDDFDNVQAASAVVPGAGDDTSKERKTTLMEKFRKLSVTFQGKFSGNSKNDTDDSILAHRSVYESKNSDTIAMWVDADEVVPCLSSNRRRPAEIISVCDEFIAAVKASRASLNASASKDSGSKQRGFGGICLPDSDSLFSHRQPFYFGLDCRPAEERVIGRFPKAYVIDPSFISDADSITALLEVMEPLASTVHLCIIGSGDEFTRFVHQASSNATLSKALKEANTRMVAVAHFFLKRGFRHVSILEGGFVAAAKYLSKTDSHRSIASSLVDVDINALNSVLGINQSAHSVGSVVVAHSDTAVNATVPASAGSTLASNNVGAFMKEAPAALNSLLSTASALLKKETSKSIPSGATNESSPAVVQPAANSGPTSAVSQESVAAAKAMISDFGKRMSIFGSSSLETIKKSGWMSGIVGGDNATGAAATASSSATSAPAPSRAAIVTDNRSPSPAFTIDDDDDNVDDGMGPRDHDATKVTVSKTDQERAQALAMHKLAGLRKGDSVMIGRDSLPGAILFPAVKFKTIEGEFGPDDQPKQQLVHRFLVVTRERFIVLDSHGGGVGSEATVKSNHHLTELLKMTFRKKDPELVTLFFLSPGSASGEAKTRQYRVSKRSEFVTALQKNMQRFK